MLHWPDILILVAFFVGMALMGLWFARRNRNTEAYFLGGRALPGWAVGLSMLGTAISSVTFLALPAAAYVLDYRQLTPNLMMPVVALLAVWLLVPFFRRNPDTVTAYQFLERRFGPGVRVYAAAGFVVSQAIRLATVLYLVAIPVARMTGVSIETAIVVGGLVVVFYSAVGGLEAVVWTDVVQTVVLLGGGLLCVGLILWRLPGGAGEVLRVGMEHDKFSLGPMAWGLGERTLPVMVTLGLVSFATEHMSNQNIVQRWLAAKSLGEARKATLLCAFACVPTWLCFFFLGTCLFVFYRHFPERLPEGTAADGVLPHFILSELPAGLPGVIITACIAAAMSTLSSSINAISTTATVDFIQRWGRRRDETHTLRLAKLVSWGAGLFMIAGALVIDRIPRESIVDFNLIIGSVFGGGILAIYLLGLFVARVGNRALWFGLALGLAVNVHLGLNALGVLPEALRTNIHPYATVIVVNAVVLLFALAGTRLFPRK